MFLCAQPVPSLSKIQLLMVVTFKLYWGYCICVSCRSTTAHKGKQMILLVPAHLMLGGR